MKKTWILSLIGLGLAVWIARGLNLGVDFTGGAILKYEFAQPYHECELHQVRKNSKEE